MTRVVICYENYIWTNIFDTIFKILTWQGSFYFFSCKCFNYMVPYTIRRIGFAKWKRERKRERGRENECCKVVELKLHCNQWEKEGEKWSIASVCVDYRRQWVPKVVDDNHFIIPTVPFNRSVSPLHLFPPCVFVERCSSLQNPYFVYLILWNRVAESWTWKSLFLMTLNIKVENFHLFNPKVCVKEWFNLILKVWLIWGCWFRWRVCV